MEAKLKPKEGKVKFHLSHFFFFPLQLDIIKPTQCKMKTKSKKGGPGNSAGMIGTVAPYYKGNKQIKIT